MSGCAGPSRSCALVLILTCISGCTHRAPGETFSAGYIFPDEQTTVSHAFIVTNTTTEAVEIRKVEKSCSCASYKLSKSQLAPGESTTLTIDVHVTNNYMQKFAGCILKTDHPK